MRKGYSAIIIAVVAALIAVFATMNSSNKKGLSLYSVDHQYANFMSRHGKSYGTKEEYEHRKMLFSQALKTIEEINSNPDNTYTVAPNKFADWTEAEKQRLFGFLPDPDFEDSLPTEELQNETLVDDLDSVANSVDWRGYMPAVKNQGSCGSCWAFSAVGALEGRYAIAYGTGYQFSEQQLVDCSRNYGNQGCNGGWYYSSFKYWQDYGVASERSYPYKGYDDRCNYSGRPDARISGYRNLNKYSEPELSRALQSGPVSVAVEATGSSFYYYKSGIINNNCGTTLNHAVLAVGYSDGYWIVRNSWGSGWGESGYVRILRTADEGGSGMCGIYSGPPSYPTV